MTTPTVPTPQNPWERQGEAHDLLLHAHGYEGKELLELTEEKLRVMIPHTPQETLSILHTPLHGMDRQAAMEHFWEEAIALTNDEVRTMLRKLGKFFTDSLVPVRLPQIDLEREKKLKEMGKEVSHTGDWHERHLEPLLLEILGGNSETKELVTTQLGVRMVTAGLLQVEEETLEHYRKEALEYLENHMTMEQGVSVLTGLLGISDTYTVEEFCKIYPYFTKEDILMASLVGTEKRGGLPRGYVPYRIEGGRLLFVDPGSFNERDRHQMRTDPHNPEYVLMHGGVSVPLEAPVVGAVDMLGLTAMSDYAIAAYLLETHGSVARGITMMRQGKVPVSSIPTLQVVFPDSGHVLSSKDSLLFWSTLRRLPKSLMEGAKQFVAIPEGLGVWCVTAEHCEYLPYHPHVLIHGRHGLRDMVRGSDGSGSVKVAIEHQIQSLAKKKAALDPWMTPIEAASQALQHMGVSVPTMIQHVAGQWYGDRRISTARFSYEEMELLQRFFAMVPSTIRQGVRMVQKLQDRGEPLGVSQVGGLFIPESKMIAVYNDNIANNPAVYEALQGQGEHTEANHIAFTLLTVAHELGHVLWGMLSEEEQRAFLRISRWVSGSHRVLEENIPNHFMTQSAHSGLLDSDGEEDFAEHVKAWLCVPRRCLQHCGNGVQQKIQFIRKIWEAHGGAKEGVVAMWQEYSRGPQAEEIRRHMEEYFALQARYGLVGDSTFHSEQMKRESAWMARNTSTKVRKIDAATSAGMVVDMEAYRSMIKDCYIEVISPRLKEEQEKLSLLFFELYFWERFDIGIDMEAEDYPETEAGKCEQLWEHSTLAGKIALTQQYGMHPEIQELALVLSNLLDGAAAIEGIVPSLINDLRSWNRLGSTQQEEKKEEIWSTLEEALPPLTGGELEMLWMHIAEQMIGVELLVEQTPLSIPGIPEGMQPVLRHSIEAEMLEEEYKEQLEEMGY